MADTKISDLPAVTDVLSTDEYVLARAGDSNKITAADLGAGLVSGALELAYVEFTSPVSITSTTEAGANSVVSAGSVAFDGSTRVRIEFFSPDVLAGSTAGSYTILTLWDGSTDLGRIAVVGHSLLVFAPEVAVKAERYLTPTAASHTYTIKAWRVASDGTVSAGAGGTGVLLPGFIRIARA